MIMPRWRYKMRVMRALNDDYAMSIYALRRVIREDA